MPIRSKGLLKIVYFVLAACTASAYPSPGSDSKPTHDVAITNVSVPSSCAAGDTAPITISVANQGAHRETLRLILTDKASGQEIASQEVTLAKGWKDGSGDAADVIFDAETENANILGTYDTIADFNGDNIEDLLVCANAYDGDSRGRAYILYGGSNFDNQPDVVFTGENAGDKFGEGACAGDFNNDNHQDVVIGADRYNSNRGRVYIYYGGPDIDNTADIIFDCPDVNDVIFGRFLTTGDFNGDTFDDLVVTMTAYDNWKGRSYLYYGGAGPIDATPDKTFDGEEAQQRQGRQVHAGDVDGDGFDDLILGSRDYDGGGSGNIGRVYLYWGAEGTSMDTKAGLIFTGEEDGGDFGSSVEVADIDADGGGEIIIGARYWGRYQGKIYIYWGGTGNIDPAAKADLCLYGEAVYRSHLGGDTIAVGDFNSDNYLDILSGGFGADPGRAYIFYGNEKAKMDNVADKMFIGEYVDGMYGAWVEAGDLNNDGFDDVVVTDTRYNESPNRCGRVYFYYGPFSNTTDITFNWNTTNTSPGKHILKASIAPVAGEEDVADNTMTVTVEVKEPSK